MNELKMALGEHRDCTLRFILPNGVAVPEHAHVTEVARIDKRFVDCGGKLRADAVCRLQTWVADDVHHRLVAGKLLGILDQAAGILQSEELEVDIEHEAGWISQFPVESVSAVNGELVLRLTARHTACLAEDQCMRPPPGLNDFKPQSLEFKPLAKRA